MLGEHSGQMLVAAVLVMGLLVMSLLVAAYQAHALFLRTRSVVAREAVSAITADFNRALATMLALATRSYYDSARFSDFTSRFESYGLEPRNLDSAKRVAFRYLNAWANLQRIVYAEHGVQISWCPCVSDVSQLLGRPAYVFDLILIDWNKTTSGSYVCARLQLNLTNVGFYHWVSASLIGLTLSIDQSCSGEDTLRIRVLADNGTYYGLLLAKGWVEVYLLDSGGWRRIPIKDVTYEGFGIYRLRLEEDIKDGSRVLVVVSDERGILVLGQATLQGGC
ncbi:MAG: hypothetical protein QXM08_04410 [Thermofilaceae archaeon]